MMIKIEGWRKQSSALKICVAESKEKALKIAFQSQNGRNKSTPVERLRSTSKQSPKLWRESGIFPCFTRLFHSRANGNDFEFFQYSIAHFLQKGNTYHNTKCIFKANASHTTSMPRPVKNMRESSQRWSWKWRLKSKRREEEKAGGKCVMK